MIRNKGFTLVEMAIVLVVVGLLIGAVLQGYELTTNAKVKALAKDYEGIRTAHYAFIDRKGIYPGQSAETGEVTNAVALTDSDTDFFGELAKEGFFTDQNIAPPKGIASGYEVFYAADQDEADTNNATLSGVNQICGTRIDGIVAKGLDFKFDDGVPDGGLMRAETGIDSPETEYEKNVLVTLCLKL